MSFVFRAAENPELSEDVVGVVDQENYTVTVTFPEVVSHLSLKPTIKSSDGASVSPASEVPNNFTSDVRYLVASQSGEPQQYTISVTRAEPTTDRESLIFFFDANYRVLDWDLGDETMNSWTGVTHEDGNVTRLELSDSNIVSFTKELGYLSHLEYIDLSSNKISHFPETIGQLTGLKTLLLNNNSLVGLPETIGNLTNLEEFTLYSNSLTSVPVEVGNLINLDYLVLSFNSLTTVPQEVCDLETNYGTNVDLDEGVQCVE
ncbi:leucine-rich repeat domain-containing protein [Aquimarina pacifica]|uniref:leucine-rich repeat domain-containing protein n=1 Tax=Aquimarina pacifica TaxID=1296415 RepID=UPI000471BC7F|nr:leucine-rich repeat domain-containing protein [Aquimarina pacifica]